MWKLSPSDLACQERVTHGLRGLTLHLLSKAFEEKILL